MDEFKRDIKDLKRNACLYWPTELTTREASKSIVPLLIETQDTFISLLDVSDSSPAAWKKALGASKRLYPNLFLKHLMVLADFGGEPLKRLKNELVKIFPDNKMVFTWQGKNHEYVFKAITTTKKLDNVSLFVDGKKLVEEHALDDRMEDVIMLILHGGTSLNDTPNIIKERCVIGGLLGNKEELERFVKQRYIWVSRITGGATANTLGQLAQDYVKDLLDSKLPDWKFIRNGTIPGISQNQGRTDINFDIIARSPIGIYVGIEVAFQFTTNSVIERKAGQAESRAKLLKENKCFIAYVIDGAGNFERAAAVNTILRFSDCTVALTPKEIDRLVAFLTHVDGLK